MVLKDRVVWSAFTIRDRTGKYRDEHVPKGTTLTDVVERRTGLSFSVRYPNGETGRFVDVHKALIELHTKEVESVEGS